MSPAVAQRPPLFREPFRTPRSDGGRPTTIGQKLDRVWEGLAVVGVAECPLCQERMTATATGAKCESCGARLS